LCLLANILLPKEKTAKRLVSIPSSFLSVQPAWQLGWHRHGIASFCCGEAKY
jgi:hypothetical protein